MKGRKGGVNLLDSGFVPPVPSPRTRVDTNRKEGRAHKLLFTSAGGGATSVSDVTAGAGAGLFTKSNINSTTS